MTVWAVICTAISLLYFLQLLKAYWYWEELPWFKLVNKRPQCGISIVVAMRNERKAIPTLIESYNELNYPADLMELIIVDDYSDDGTDELAANAAKQNENIRFISTADRSSITARVEGKKAAVLTGAQEARFDWVMTTDMDCKLPHNQLLALDQFIDIHHPKLIAGGVRYYQNQKLFHRIQALEFAGLVALGAGFIKRKIPLLINGANMCFQRGLYLDLQSDPLGQEGASGDDTWFLQKVFNRYPYEVYFLKSDEAIVETQACDSVKELLNQRKRWSAKNGSVKAPGLKLILSYNYVFYCLLLFNLIMGIYSYDFAALALLMLIFKVPVELFFYLAIRRFFKLPLVVFHYLLALPFQIVYMVVVYPLAKWQGFQWKKRHFSE